MYEHGKNLAHLQPVLLFKDSSALEKQNRLQMSQVFPLLRILIIRPF